MNKASLSPRGGGGGGDETVYVKKEVPWPHNYVLGGPKNLGCPMML